MGAVRANLADPLGRVLRPDERGAQACASRTSHDVSAWTNSTVVDGDVLDRVARERQGRGVIIAGSVSVLRAVQDNDLIDEYRLLTFPSVVASGERLFRGHGHLENLTCTRAELAGAAVLTCYDVAR